MRAQTKRDLSLLCTSALVVPAIWLGLLGWGVARSSAGHDVLTCVQLFVRELSASRGDWTSLVYRMEPAGGVDLVEVIGAKPSRVLCAWLGLSPRAALDVSTWLVQVALAFLSTRGALALASLWSSSSAGPAREGVGLYALGAVLTAFAPIVGWRIAYGHMDLLGACLAWVALLSLVLVGLARVHSPVSTLVGGLALLDAAPSAEQQLIVYGALFGAPILAGALWSFRARWRLEVIGLPLALCLAAVLVSLPVLWGVVSHAASNDAARQIGGEAVVYSYTTATLHDLVGSLSWGMSVVPSERFVDLWHEVNYPVGPLLLLAAFGPWRRSRALAVGWVSSVACAALFSANVSPFSDAALGAVPALGWFRVPARALLPAVLTLPLLALAVVFARWPNERPTRAWASSLGLCAAVAVAWLVRPGSFWMEGLFWLAAAALGVLLARRLPRAGDLRFACLAMLALGSTLAFRERQFALDELSGPAPDFGELRQRLYALEPRLSSALTRARIAFNEPPPRHNTAWASGVSSLDGYWKPPRRFLELAMALDDEPFDPTRQHLRFQPGTASFAVLSQLYDVVGSFTRSGGAITLERGGPTAGEAWFSARVERVQSVQQLAAELRANAQGLAEEAHRVTWVVAEDPAVRAADLPNTLAHPIVGCAAARVGSVQARHGSQEIRLATHTTELCPLTLATNYSRRFVAEGKRAGESTATALMTFPAYGAELGVLVPAGVTEVILRAEPSRPAGGGAATWVGWLCFGSALWWARRLRAEDRILPLLRLRAPRLERWVPGVLLAAVALVHAPNLGHSFASDDFFWLDAFATKPLSAVLESTRGWLPVHVVHPILKLHFWVAFQRFDTWYPGHAALVILVHLGAVLALYALALRCSTGPGVALTAALLFGITGSSGGLAWVCTVHHAYLVLCGLVVLLAYARDLRPTSVVLPAALVAALVGVHTSEAGAMVILGPWALAALRWAGGERPTRRQLALLGVVLVAASSLFLRLRPEQLSGAEPVLDIGNPNYTVSWSFERTTAHLASIASSATGLPTLLLPFVAIPVFAAARSGTHAPTVRLGLAMMALGALPLAVALVEPPLRYGYLTAPGAALALAGALAWAVDRTKPAQRILAVIAAALAVAALSFSHLRARSEVAARYHRHDDSMRAVAVALRKLDGPGVPRVILYGLPFEPGLVNQPTVLDRALPILAPGRSLELYAVAPERLVLQSNVYVEYGPTPPCSVVSDPRTRRLMVRGGAVLDCDAPASLGLCPARAKC